MRPWEPRRIATLLTIGEGIRKFQRIWALRARTGDPPWSDRHFHPDRRIGKLAVSRQFGFQKAFGNQAVNQRGETVRRKFLAPQVGLEPTTLRLTAECSTIELLRSNTGGLSSLDQSLLLLSTQSSDVCSTSRRHSTRSASHRPPIQTRVYIKYRHELAATGLLSAPGGRINCLPRKRSSPRHPCCPNPCTSPPADMDTAAASAPLRLRDCHPPYTSRR
jgi:hypothetical protein